MYKWVVHRFLRYDAIRCNKKVSHPSYVQRHVAISNNHGSISRLEIYIKICVEWMPVVPKYKKVWMCAHLCARKCLERYGCLLMYLHTHHEWKGLWTCFQGDAHQTYQFTNARADMHPFKDSPGTLSWVSPAAPYAKTTAWYILRSSSNVTSAPTLTLPMNWQPGISRICVDSKKHDYKQVWREWCSFQHM
jgi:hypothetical protein